MDEKVYAQHAKDASLAVSEVLRHIEAADMKGTRANQDFVYNQLLGADHALAQLMGYFARSMNTKINYTYRDADNYKVHNTCIIAGILDENQKAAILSSLDEGEYFIPELVGLPAERFSEFDPQSDHPWFELGEYSFEETTASPDVLITPEALVAAFEDCKGQWEELVFLEAMEQQEAPRKSLDEIIKSAAESAGPGPHQESKSIGRDVKDQPDYSGR